MEKQSKLSEKIRKLRILYEQIYDAKELLHRCFAWPLLMSIGFVFMEIVFFTFLNIIKFQKNISGTSLKEALSVHILGAVTLAKLIITIAISDKMSNEMKMTGLNLARLRSNTSDIKEKNEARKFKKFVQNLHELDRDCLFRIFNCRLMLSCKNISSWTLISRLLVL